MISTRRARRQNGHFTRFLARQFVEVVILIEFVALVSDEALVWQLDVALISPLLMDGMESKTFFCQITANGEVSSSLWREQVGYIHQYLCLCVWLQYIQHIIADDGIELSFREVRAIVIIIANYIMPLLLQFICIETIAAAEVENLPFQQIHLFVFFFSANTTFRRLMSFSILGNFFNLVTKLIIYFEKTHKIMLYLTLLFVLFPYSHFSV